VSLCDRCCKRLFLYVEGDAAGAPDEPEPGRARLSDILIPLEQIGAIWAFGRCGVYDRRPQMCRMFEAGSGGGAEGGPDG